MRRLAFSLLLAYFLLFSFCSTTSAQASKADMGINVTYSVSEQGITTVTHDISVKNTTTFFYTKSFDLILSSGDPKNIVVKENEKILATNVERSGTSVKIHIKFEESVVGVGKERRFLVTFQDKTLTKKIGEVWEINLPFQQNQAFNSYNLTLDVPKSFGENVHFSSLPLGKRSDNTRTYFYFDGLAQGTMPLSAAFGGLQVYAFEITYHLVNPIGKTSKVEIALPPDSEYQKVYYDFLSPKPDAIFQDVDSNWIGQYLLEPGQRSDVKTAGFIEVYDQAVRKAPTDQNFEKYLKPTNFWQSDDPKIASLAKELGANPQAIYDFVVSYLNYDYDRVKPNSPRLGALAALEKPLSAICTEFTDLFIALARASGIPAREVNGFAYTENSKLEPLSLVADILHAWPEYWKEDKKMWVQIDPTWAKTGGIDYFTNFDLKHLKFVTHGVDSEKPFPAGSYKLGFVPQKDVFVKPANLPAQRNIVAQIVISPKNNFPIKNMAYLVTVENPGPSALYDQEIEIYYDQKLIEKKSLARLLPFEKQSFELSVPVGFLGRQTPQSLTIGFAGQKAVSETARNLTIIIGLTVILSSFLAFIFLLFIALTRNRWKQNH